MSRSRVIAQVGYPDSVIAYYRLPSGENFNARGDAENELSRASVRLLRALFRAAGATQIEEGPVQYRLSPRGDVRELGRWGMMRVGSQAERHNVASLRNSAVDAVKALDELKINPSSSYFSLPPSIYPVPHGQDGARVPGLWVPDE